MQNRVQKQTALFLNVKAVRMLEKWLNMSYILKILHHVELKYSLIFLISSINP
jgi:hypothetical protein